MAGPTWFEKNSLIDELFRQPSEFSYFQTLRLLALVRQDQNLPLMDMVRRELLVQADLSMAFPSSDLVKIEKLKVGGSAQEAPGPGSEAKETLVSGDSSPEALTRRWLRLTVSFMGLYGSASPLPPIYSKEVISEAFEDITVCRDLFDLISLPSYLNHAEAYFHDRLPFRLLEEGDPSTRFTLSCLMGLGHQSLRGDYAGAEDIFRELFFMARHSRSAQGLVSLLTRRFGLSRVSLTQCVPRIVPIGEPDRIRLGVPGPGSLGENALLGHETKDLRGKFNIIIRADTPEQFIELMPEGKLRGRLESAVDEYISEPLIYDLVLRYHPGAQRGLVLGEGPYRRLGIHAFVSPPERRLYRLESPQIGGFRRVSNQPEIHGWSQKVETMTIDLMAARATLGSGPDADREVSNSMTMEAEVA